MREGEEGKEEGYRRPRKCHQRQYRGSPPLDGDYYRFWCWWKSSSRLGGPSAAAVTEIGGHRPSVEATADIGDGANFGPPRRWGRGEVEECEKLVDWLMVRPMMVLTLVYWCEKVEVRFGPLPTAVFGGRETVERSSAPLHWQLTP